ncbi:MAG: RNA polymerase sigma factor [Myxococcota bacterium]
MSGDELADGQSPSPEDIVAYCRRRIDDFRQLAPHDREDAVQQAATRVLEAVQRGAVTHVEAYARRVAYHCAVDLWRRRRESRHVVFDEQQPIGYEEPLDAVLGATPEQLADEKRRIHSLHGVARDLRELLLRAPDNYRHVLVQHYLEGRTFDSLVDEELERRVAAGVLSSADAHDPRHRKRVRNALHAWHGRAIRWLQQRAPDAWREVIP